MIEVDVNVRGGFAAQPLLVKLGSLIVFAGFVVCGGFIPTSLAVAVIMGVGKPAPNWLGTVGALAFSWAMAGIGAWFNCSFLSWIRSGDLDFRAGCLFILGTILVSALVAGSAAALGVWAEVFLAACAIWLICWASAWIPIVLGHAIGGAGDE